MKKIMTLTGLILGLTMATVTNAAQYETKDVLGRLLIMDQVTGSVQGVVEVREAQKQDNVMGDIFTTVNLQNFKGQPLKMTCAGTFESDEQQLVVVCDKIKVLALKLNNSNENIASYLQGSFMSAEFTLVDRPLTNSAEKIAVDIKNLDIK